MIAEFVARVSRVAVLAVAVTGLPAASSAESLGDALASAYEHSGLLEQNRALLRAADEAAQSTDARTDLTGS